MLTHRHAQAAALAAALWCARGVASAALGLPSRRSANAAYALWILAHNAATLAALIALEAAVAALAAAAPPPPPRLVAAVSRAMLPTFLAANVLTVRPASASVACGGNARRANMHHAAQGVVNLSIETMAVADTAAAVGLTAYLAAVCGAALLAAGRGV